jgi:hypothetical protein
VTKHVVALQHPAALHIVSHHNIYIEVKTILENLTISSWKVLNTPISGPNTHQRNPLRIWPFTAIVGHSENYLSGVVENHIVLQINGIRHTRRGNEWLRFDVTTLDLMPLHRHKTQVDDTRVRPCRHQRDEHCGWDDPTHRGTTLEEMMIGSLASSSTAIVMETL